MKRACLILAIAASSVITGWAQQRFVAALTGSQEVPPAASDGKATCQVLLNAAQTRVTVSLTFSALGSPATAASINGNAGTGSVAGTLFDLGAVSGASGTVGPLSFDVTPSQVDALRSHNWYANIKTTNFANGELRGQVKPVNTVFDYDGDGCTDITVYRDSTRTFWILSSLTGSITAMKVGTPVGVSDGDGRTEAPWFWLNHTWDFDGDGRGDPLIVTWNGADSFFWTVFQTSDQTARALQWGSRSGATLDSIAPADYDGDGVEDIAIFRRTTGDWWITRSSDGTVAVPHWGAPDDYPAIGDYDGDGRDDLTVIRPGGASFAWWTQFSSNGQAHSVSWGDPATDNTYFFLPVDIDNDGKQDRMVIRNVDGHSEYHFLRSSDLTWLPISWGLENDWKLFGDYDGDGRTDLVARRNVNGHLVWYILLSSSGYTQARSVSWGMPGDQ